MIGQTADKQSKWYARLQAVKNCLKQGGKHYDMFGRRLICFCGYHMVNIINLIHAQIFKDIQHFDLQTWQLLMKNRFIVTF